MSKKSNGHLTFATFCRKVNQNSTYRKDYIANPCLLVAKDLGIRLSEEQCKELEVTVKDLQKRIPDFRLFVAGRGAQLNPQTGGLQAH